MDYEGQPANHVAFRAADKVIVPDCFPSAALRRFGARSGKVCKYDGFKEQVYLSGFTADSSFVGELIASCELPDDWSPDRVVLAVARTPATMAAYHRFDAPLFDELLANLNSRHDVAAIVLPRTEQQRRLLQSQYTNLLVPRHTLDGRQLVSHADLVISAGGTMNREAAILGTPAFTLFAGEIPAVDRRLIELGRMIAVRSTADLECIRYEKKRPGQSLPNYSLAGELAAAILD
jgi:predicted glycosyltransferase